MRLSLPKLDSKWCRHHRKVSKLNVKNSNHCSINITKHKLRKGEQAPKVYDIEKPYIQLQHTGMAMMVGAMYSRFQKKKETNLLWRVKRGGIWQFLHRERAKLRLLMIDLEEIFPTQSSEFIESLYFESNSEKKNCWNKTPEKSHFSPKYLFL